MQADQHIAARNRLQRGKGARQDGRADLGAAAATTHAARRLRLLRLIRTQWHAGERGGSGDSFGHGRELAEPAHETPVDPVLPAPDPGPGKTHRAARRHRVPVPGADQRQPAPLRPVGLQRLFQHRAAQVVGQRAPHAHGKHARLLQPMAVHARAVAGREDQRVGDRLQVVVDPDEAFIVQRQAGAAQPVGTAGAGDPDDFIHADPVAGLGSHAVGRHLAHRRGAIHLHPALAQYGVETPAHPRVVGRQDGGVVGEKMQYQLVGITPERPQFLAQAVLHGERQFDATCAASHHGNRRRPGLPAHTVEQRQPALVELEHGFDRHRMYTGARHLPDLRGRADVQREPVISHRGAVPQQHAATCAVDAGDLAHDQTRAGKSRQSGQIHMDFVVAVVARHITGQHAGIGSVHIGADQRQAHTRERVHGKLPQHAHMAVAAANQNDVAHHRLF